MSLLDKLRKKSENTTAPEDRIPVREKVAIGCGGVARGIQDTADNMLITPIFVLGVGIAPWVMSMAGLMYRLFDAVTDAVMGVISDNTRTRWGRRRPYLALGAVGMALAMPILFLFDPEWSIWTITAWMIGASLLIFLTQTIFNIPYQSLKLEVSPDSDERTRLISFTAYFGLSVQILMSWSWKVAQQFENEAHPLPILEGALWMISGLSLLVLVLGMMPAIFAKERLYKKAAKQLKLGVWKNMKLSFKRRSFLLLAAFVFLFLLGFNLKWTLLFFVRYYHVCEGDEALAAELTGWGGSLQVVFSIIGISLTRWLSFRIGKLNTMRFLIMTVFIVSLFLGLFYTPAFPYLSIVPAFFFGPALSGMWVLVPAMTADIVDEDELVTGERREGAFASVFSWLVKAALTIASAISGPLAHLAGYQSELRDNLPEPVVGNMVLLVSVVPAFFIGIAYLFLNRFPLTTEAVEANQRELKSRKNGGGANGEGP